MNRSPRAGLEFRDDNIAHPGDAWVVSQRLVPGSDPSRQGDWLSSGFPNLVDILAQISYIRMAGATEIL